jgi:hypothetical protein
VSIKNGIAGILGRRVTAVLVTMNPGNTPRQQIFLVLDDRWTYEIYGSQVDSASGVLEWDANQALEYAKGFAGKITTYGVEAEVAPVG